LSFASYFHPFYGFPQNTVASEKLRGYDAVHLACALNFNQFVTTNGYLPITFVSADNDLLQVAQAEGLLIENPNLYP